jgi:hypothetical protein
VKSTGKQRKKVARAMRQVAWATAIATGKLTDSLSRGVIPDEEVDATRARLDDVIATLDRLNVVLRATQGDK